MVAASEHQLIKLQCVIQQVIMEMQKHKAGNVNVTDLGNSKANENYCATSQTSNQSARTFKTVISS